MSRFFDLATASHWINRGLFPLLRSQVTVAVVRPHGGGRGLGRSHCLATKAAMMIEKKPPLDYATPSPKRLGIWVAFAFAALFIALYVAVLWYLNKNGA